MLGWACSAASLVDDVRIDQWFFVRCMNLGFNLFTVLKISIQRFADLHTLCIFVICKADLYKLNHGHRKGIVGLVPEFFRSSP